MGDFEAELGGGVNGDQFYEEDLYGDMSGGGGGEEAPEDGGGGDIYGDIYGDVGEASELAASEVVDADEQAKQQQQPPGRQPGDGMAHQQSFQHQPQGPGQLLPTAQGPRPNFGLPVVMGAVQLSNLQWWTTDAEIEAVCGEFGGVANVRFFEDKANGKSKGSAIVEFTDPEAPIRCRDSLSGRQLNGKLVSVALHRVGGVGGFSGGGGRGGRGHSQGGGYGRGSGGGGGRGRVQGPGGQGHMGGGMMPHHGMMGDPSMMGIMMSSPMAMGGMHHMGMMGAMGGMGGMPSFPPPPPPPPSRKADSSRAASGGGGGDDRDSKRHRSQ